MNCPSCGSGLLSEAVYCNVCGVMIGCPPGPVRYAGFWRRVIAVFIDMVLLTPAILLGRDLFLTPPSQAEQRAMGQMFSNQLSYTECLDAQIKFTLWLSYFGTEIFFVCAPYYIIAESSALRGTLGKRALGLQVTDLDHNRIGLGRAAKRYAARLLSAFPWQLGFIMAGFTDKRQALHDIVAGTLVVLRRPKAAS